MVPDIIDIPALIFLSLAMFLGEYILVSVPFVHVFHARLSGKSRPPKQTMWCFAGDCVIHRGYPGLIHTALFFARLS